MAAVDAFTTQRLFFPGEALMLEGDRGQDLVILVRGQVRIEIAGKVVRDVTVDVAQGSGRRGTARGAGRSRGRGRRLAPKPSEEAPRAVPFGDLSFLGLREARGASVIAVSICQARVVYKAIFDRALRDAGASVEASAGSGQPSSPTLTAEDERVSAFSRLGIFEAADVSQDFLRFLAKHVEPQSCAAGDVIVQRGVEDAGSMWLVDSGSLYVEKDDVIVAELGAGDMFGETAALGVAGKRTCSIVARSSCHLSALHQQVVMRGLELFPAERQRVLFHALEEKSRRQGLWHHHAGADDAVEEKELLTKLISQSPLFAHTSEAVMSALGAQAQHRIFMKGEVVMRQGAPGESMFVLISGVVGVYKQQTAPGTPEFRKSHANIHGQRSRLTSLQPGCIIGEFAALGISDSRTATIEAEALTSMWEIHRSSVLAVLEKFPVARRHFAETMCLRLDDKVPSRIMGLPLFAEFPEKFRQLVALNVEKRLYFPGTEIAREGCVGNSMLVINLGTCVLKKRGVVVKLYVAGTCFASHCMLGIRDDYIGTLVCRDTCHVLGISRACYAHALDQQPAAQAKQKLASQERQATKEMQSSLLKVSVRKRLWEALEDVAVEGVHEATIGEVFGAWLRAANRLRDERASSCAAKAKRDLHQAQWLERGRQAREKARLRRLDELAPVARELGRRAAQLPRIDGAAAPEALQRLCEDWPTPRASKFYKLRLWNVLGDMASPGKAVPLLPLLNKFPAEPQGEGACPPVVPHAGL